MILDPEILSVVAAGAFTIVGLVTSFRNPTTRRVTPWGWVSICGVLLSVGFGLWQIRAHARSEGEQIARLERIANTTQKTLDSLPRLLLPLKVSTYSVEFAFPLACQPPSPCLRDAGSLNDIGGDGLNLYFFKDPAKISAFLAGGMFRVKPDFSVSGGQRETADIGSSGDAKYTYLPIGYSAPGQQVAGDAILSAVDLSGSTVFVIGNGETFQSTSVSDVDLLMMNGLDVNIRGPFKKSVMWVPEVRRNQTVYYATVPQIGR
ncbi:MAG: hypothetical protein ABSC48_15120 [Terracidiphilus sp.]|jgi:hypothetical protein